MTCSVACEIAIRQAQVASQYLPSLRLAVASSFSTRWLSSLWFLEDWRALFRISTGPIRFFCRLMCSYQPAPQPSVL